MAIFLSHKYKQSAGRRSGPVYCLFTVTFRGQFPFKLFSHGNIHVIVAVQRLFGLRGSLSVRGPAARGRLSMLNLALFVANNRANTSLLRGLASGVSGGVRNVAYFVPTD